MTGIGHVSVRDLAVRFPGPRGGLALEGISLELPAGSFTAVIAPALFVVGLAILGLDNFKSGQTVEDL